MGENGPQANFCSNCGSPLNLLVCSHCERINERGTATCMYCESALPDTEVDAPRSAEPAQNAEERNEKTTEDWRALLQHIEEEISRLDARSMASPASNEENESRAVTSVAIDSPEIELAENKSPEFDPPQAKPRRTRALSFSPPDTITIDHLTSTAEPSKSWGKLAVLFVVSAAFAGYLFISLPQFVSTPAAVNNVMKQDTRTVFSPATEVRQAEADADAPSAAIPRTASLMRDEGAKVLAEPLLRPVQAGLTSLNDAPPKPLVKTMKKPPPRRASAAKQDQWDVLRGRLY